MKYIDIAGLDKKVSQLIMGSDFFHPDRIEEVSYILDEYVRIGGNTIDSAYIYVGGNSEKALGMWHQSRNNREDIVLWTKGGHPDHTGPTINKVEIYDQLMTSLERLQTDYVDLYALHRDDPNVEVGVIVEILNEHVEAGRIRSFGGSNWTHQRLEEANAYAEKHGLVGFSFNSPNLSLAKAQEPYWADCVSADDETVAWHERTQMPLLSWSAQARGFFTGRFTRDDRSNEELVRVFYNDSNWAIYDRAEEMAKEKGVSTIQIALAYVLNQSFPTCALVGPQNKEEMESCLEGTKIVLTQKEIEWLLTGN